MDCGCEEMAFMDAVLPCYRHELDYDIHNDEICRVQPDVAILLFRDRRSWQCPMECACNSSWADSNRMDCSLLSLSQENLPQGLTRGLLGIWDDI